MIGDFSKFGKDAEKKLNRELHELGRHANFKDLVDAAADAGEQAGQEFVDEFGDQVVRGGRKAGKLSGKAMKDAIGEALDGVRDTAEGTFDFISNAVTSVGKGLTSVVALTSKLGPALIAKLIAGPPVIAALILGLSGLASQLSNLLGLLGLIPGAASVAIASFVPLIVAFQGFGDAIEAIVDGDPDKIREALKGLSPAARSVAKEFQKVLPVFREMRKIVQQAFFQEMTGALTRLAVALSPALTGGMALVATAFGELADVFSRKLATPQVADAIARIFEVTARVVAALGGGGLRLLEGFLAVIVASLPTVEKLATAFAGLLTNLGDKLLAAVQNGEFQRWLDEALATAGTLFTTFTLLMETIRILFSLTDSEGKAFLDNINEALRVLNSYLKDPTVKQALLGLIQLFKFIVFQIVAAGIAFASMALFVGFVIQKVRDLLHWIDRLAAKSSVFNIIRPFLVSPLVPKLLAEGDVIRRPTLAVVGEAGPEAVVPLNNPRRARQVMSQAGLLDMGFGGGAQAPLVQVFLGTQEITDILDVRVHRAIGAESRALANGPRAA